MYVRRLHRLYGFRTIYGSLFCTEGLRRLYRLHGRNGRRRGRYISESRLPVAVPECPRRIQVLPACVVRENLCGPSGFLTAVHGIGVCRGIRIGKSTVIYGRLIGVCGRTLIDVRVAVKN